MLRVRHFALAGLLAIAGAGCIRSATQTVPVDSTVPPLGHVPTPVVTSTESIPAGWERVSFGDIWSLYQPGRAAPELGEPSLDTRLRRFTADLGTAVEEPGEKAVPRRTLTIERLLPGDDYLSLGCVATSTRFGTPTSVVSTSTAQQVSACLRTFVEGAAGSQYHTLSATLLSLQDAYVVDYTVRATNCSLYERPEEQCVAFDEARDMALFWAILATLRPGR